VNKASKRLAKMKIVSGKLINFRMIIKITRIIGVKPEPSTRALYPAVRIIEKGIAYSTENEIGIILDHYNSTTIHSRNLRLLVVDVYKSIYKTKFTSLWEYSKISC